MMHKRWLLVLNSIMGSSIVCLHGMQTRTPNFPVLRLSLDSHAMHYQPSAYPVLDLVNDPDPLPADSIEKVEGIPTRYGVYFITPDEEPPSPPVSDIDAGNSFKQIQKTEFGKSLATQLFKCFFHTCAREMGFFLLWDHMKEHVKRSPQSPTKYICEKCDRTSSRSDVVVSAHSPLFFKCNRCMHKKSSQLNSLYELMRHIKRNHVIGKPKCPYGCRKNIYPDSLKKHCKSYHPDIAEAALKEYQQNTMPSEKPFLEIKKEDFSIMWSDPSSGLYYEYNPLIKIFPSL